MSMCCEPEADGLAASRGRNALSEDEYHCLMGVRSAWVCLVSSEKYRE